MGSFVCPARWPPISWVVIANSLSVPGFEGLRTSQIGAVGMLSKRTIAVMGDTIGMNKKEMFRRVDEDPTNADDEVMTLTEMAS